jgi:MFS family permease
LFAELGIWRGVFVINVPLCLLAAWMMVRRFHEDTEPKSRSVDYRGALLLTLALTLLVLAILGGGQAWAWDSAASITAFSAGGVLLTAFFFAARRTAEPILPGFVLTRRLLLTTTVVGLGVGAILIGLTSYVPTYLEGSLGVSPVQAGLALTTLTIGWPLTAGLAGRIYLRVGFKKTACIGAGLVLTGAAALLAVAHRPNIVMVAALCFVTGCGLGLLALPALIAAQSSVDWDERGVVTGAHMFARSLGSAVGVAVFGAIANTVFGDGDVHTLGASAIQSGTAAVFLGVLVVAMVAAGAVVAMPRTPPQGQDNA